MGKEAYGVFAVISVVGNLNTFANLGLNTSLIKFLAEQGQGEESNYDIFVTVILITIIFVPLSVLAFLFKDTILINILRIPSKYYYDSALLLKYLLISSYFVMVGQTFSAILDSMNKIYISNTTQIFYNVFYWVNIILVIYFIPSLANIGMGILIASGIWLLLNIIAARKAWGKMKLFKLGENFIRVAKKQISYGSKIYFSCLITFAYEPVTKILISRFIGITEVGYYDIAIKVKGQVWGVFTRLLYPLYPLIAQITDIKRIQVMSYKIGQQLFILLVPIVCIIYFVSGPFVSLWMGPNNEIIAVSIKYITSSFLVFSIPVIPLYFFLQAKNLPSKTIAIQITNTVSNVIFILILFPFIGFYAVIAGSCLSILSSFLVSVYYQKKYLDNLLFDSFLQFGKLLLQFVFFMIIGFLTIHFIKSNFLILITVPVIMIVISFFTFKIFKMINFEDLIAYLKPKEAI
jgi:O-antigen/teichoic acid export membrane protein